MTRSPALLLLAALWLGGCAAARPPAPTAGNAPRPATAAGPSEGEDGAAAAAGLRQALRRAANEPAERSSLHLSVECRIEDRLRSLEVFGSGVGIWDGERQFRLDDGQIGKLLETLRDADFPGLAARYGGPSGPPPPVPEGEADGEAMATMMTCRIDLALAGFEKRVVQLARGEQSAVLKRLAGDLLALAEPAAGAGVGAASLRDGLDKIAAGELAPETWRLVLHRRPERAGGGSEDSAGFLLTVAGASATVRELDPATGYRDPVSLELSPEAVQTLARDLAAHDPAAWPVNLYASDYVDLSIEVLNHEKAIQARRFAGMEPSTHGERQRGLDEVLEALGRLRDEVLRRASPPPAPPPVPPGR